MKSSWAIMLPTVYIYRRKDEKETCDDSSKIKLFSGMKGYLTLYLKAGCDTSKATSHVAEIPSAHINTNAHFPA